MDDDNFIDNAIDLLELAVEKNDWILIEEAIIILKEKDYEGFDFFLDEE